MQAGRFITLEGGEGSGKTTQIKLLAASLSQSGIAVITTREPGGTDGAEDIRDLLVRGEPGKWDDISELLLFYAARREHVTKRVRPTLDEGKYVICDRFADSSRIYQGFGKGLGEGYVKALHQLVLGGFTPDLTLWLDMDAAQGIARTQSRTEGEGENRFEKLAQDFHTRVREGFEWLASQEPERVAKIDAAQSISSVHTSIIATVNSRLGLALTVQEA